MVVVGGRGGDGGVGQGAHGPGGAEWEKKGMRAWRERGRERERTEGGLRGWWSLVKLMRRRRGQQACTDWGAAWSLRGVHGMGLFMRRGNIMASPRWWSASHAPCTLSFSSPLSLFFP